MGDHESSEHSSRSGIAVVVVFVVVLGLPLLLFLPLILGVTEQSLFGTREVEAFFERIGLHDELGRIYKPVIEFFTG